MNKQWYIVKIEGTAPITVEYRVMAKDEEEAFKLVEKSPGQIHLERRPIPDLRRLVKKKVSIKNLLNGMINWVKFF